MPSLARPLAFPADATGPAPWTGVIRFVDADNGRLEVARADPPAAEPVSARWVALPGWTPRAGEEVLVAGGAEGPFVLGPLGPRSQVLELAGGVQAQADAAGETLEVRDDRGLVLFRYCAAAASGQIRLEAPSVTVAATGGDLRLEAAGEIRSDADAVRLEARRRVHAGVTGPDGRPRSALELTGAAVGIAGRRLEARFEEVAAHLQRLRGEGGVWETRVQRLSVAAERLETRAEVLVESVGSAYRRARELSQLTASRLRHIVDDSIHVRARRILQRATDAFKVRGDKIHLG